MDGRRTRTPASQDRRPGIFLVEFAGTTSGTGDAEYMHAAFCSAVARLRAAGAPIRWCGGWLVPADSRCLCLVEAADEASVVLARDTAALTFAGVHPVRRLPDPAPPARSTRSRGRS